MARPSKLTDERQQKMLEALRAGNYIETAARYAGIDDSTYRRWMHREEPQFRAFRAAVEKARADAEAHMVAVIVKAAPEYWQAAAWWLERSFPDRYGRRERREIANADGPIRVEVERPRSPERLRELLEVAVELGWSPNADAQTNNSAQV